MSINSGTGTDHIILALALCACILSAAARAFFSSLCVDFQMSSASSGCFPEQQESSSATNF